MGRLTNALLLSLMIVPLAGAQTRPDTEGDGLKGRVKTVRVTTAEVSQRDGMPFEKMKPHEFVNEYDENGFKTEERRYVSGTLREKTMYSRDDARNRTSIRYKDDGKLDSKIIQSFDAQGHPTTGAVYDADDALQSRSMHTYDADGKFLEAAIYNADGTLLNKTIFKHDSSGKLVGLEVYDASGKLLQKQLQTESGSMVTVYGQTEVDTHKRVTKASSSSELDSHGNWIKKSVPTATTRGSETVEVVEVIYREITYY